MKTCPLVLLFLLLHIPQVFCQQPELVEFYADSTNIGRKGQNKFTLERYELADSNYVILSFFRKQNGTWEPRNKYSYKKDAITSCEPEFADFNGDGLKDVTYISNVAARSSNEVRRLYVYSKAGDSLVYIKNSESYPNMQYNKHLKCIDALLIHGTSTNVFLKLKEDELREIATIDECDELIVREYDEDGNEKVIYRIKNNKIFYKRFKSYKPPVLYDGQ